ncbi:mannose-P-dolichol utilization defect 1 protein isoform X2 [Chamaea fasciata]|uniref:mannose-P-dolichol utilization defect 1 protein isoform X2 n=1 Tax=Chamaea fasciata TaxID=190680 RepID=UPI00336A0904
MASWRDPSWVPQVLKVWGSRSGGGLSLPSVLLELLALGGSVGYGCARSFPFSAWGESLFLLLQTLALLFLILHFGGRTGRADPDRRQRPAGSHGAALGAHHGAPVRGRPGPDLHLPDGNRGSPFGLDLRGLGHLQRGPAGPGAAPGGLPGPPPQKGVTPGNPAPQETPKSERFPPKLPTKKKNRHKSTPKISEIHPKKSPKFLPKIPQNSHQKNCPENPQNSLEIPPNFPQDCFFFKDKKGFPGSFPRNLTWGGARGILGAPKPSQAAPGPPKPPRTNGGRGWPRPWARSGRGRSAPLPQINLGIPHPGGASPPFFFVVVN